MNNTKVYFISADYVKQNTPIINDVENTLITSHILEAQNIDLQECLGEDLYKLFVDRLSIFNTGDSVETLLGTDYYKLFNEYVKPFLVYKTVYYSFYDLFSKLTAKGLTNQTSQYSNTSDISILEKMRKETNIKAEHYKNEMINYLNEKSSLYPEYNKSCDTCNTDNTYTGGLYLGDVEW